MGGDSIVIRDAFTAQCVEDSIKKSAPLVMLTGSINLVIKIRPSAVRDDIS